MRQGEWRDAIEGGSWAFPFMNMKVSVFCKNLSQHCTLWKPQVCKVSQPGPTPKPLQRSLSSRMFWHQLTKHSSFRIALLSSDLGCRICCPALPTQDTSQSGLVEIELSGGSCGNAVRKEKARSSRVQMCQCLERILSLVLYPESVCR